MKLLYLFISNRPTHWIIRNFSYIAMLFLLNPAFVFAQLDSEVNNVLIAAEKTFVAMEKKDYPGIWKTLTRKTKSTIIDEVSSQSACYSREQITFDFRVGGLLSRSYWNSFLENFDPKLILNQCKWEMGFIKDDDALIRLLYPVSRYPAELKLRLEKGKWKVGLVESFWGRKYISK